MYQKILVGIDQSEVSQNVFDEAVCLAKATNAEMMLLHILSPLEEPYISPIFMQPDAIYPTVPPAPAETYIRQWEELKQERLEWLRSLTNTAINTGVKTGFTQNMGDAGRIICEVARSWPADLIVLGRRGRAGLSEFFLGSVSNYVLHHAPCSVMVIQGKLSDSGTVIEKTV
ncbi:universal stress protein UspA [Nostoc sp. CENA543]|uniref:universal stress protein n=1 Tax=Nostoc sp. CENA543 TaxID=1869241 RepID=UPI000CA0F803|nr:universal stress protein [Nostoc sp. CENA543]AUT00583.1 universal stress protein UspA [Nostoc sp. CENA543]